MEIMTMGNDDFGQGSVDSANFEKEELTDMDQTIADESENEEDDAEIEDDDFESSEETDLPDDSDLPIEKESE